jgi:transcriptional regulator with XRE-family HTH domain
MSTTLSSKADMSTILYKGRADLSDSEDIRAMANDTWQSRLKAEIKAQKKSQREVSLAAGLGPGVVNSWLNDNEGKDPMMDSLLKVCAVLNVSLPRILYGYEISGDTEEILRLLERRPASRDAILRLLRDAQEP